MRHIVVFRKPGLYAGWPANNGVWIWRGVDGRDEIVVGFNVGEFDLSTKGMHPWNAVGQGSWLHARSTDGGETWSGPEPGLPVPATTPPPSPGSIRFAQTDFALKCARSGDGIGSWSWFFISYDRCRTWQGPYAVPSFGLPGVAARTDYEVLADRKCLLFLTATNERRTPGRPFCALTTDAGATWAFHSWVGPEVPGRSAHPSHVRLPDGRFVVAVRRREDPDHFMDLLISSDETATSWNVRSERFVETGGHNGNPPALVRLADGRLCVTYGYRAEPFGIRAKLSDDNGRTWTDPLVLREDGGNPDLGYTRTVQRSDGRILTIYYFNDHPDQERYIAATLWEA